MSFDIMTTLNFKSERVKVIVYSQEDLSTINLEFLLKGLKINIQIKEEKKEDFVIRINDEFDFAERNFWTIQSWYNHFKHFIKPYIIEIQPWDIFFIEGGNIIHSSNIRNSTNQTIDDDRVPFEIEENDLIIKSLINDL
jgi:hypothetical protein